GEVTRADVPMQHLVALPASAPPPQVEKPPPPPDSVVEERVEVTSLGLSLHGVFWRPKSAKGDVPVVVIVAGSGPTDHDGNNPIGGRARPYRLLAEALAERGVATLRYDKRGVGESVGKIDYNALTLGDFVADAAAMVRAARGRPHVGKVTLLG